MGDTMQGMKKEIGPALATAGGATMLAMGNPAGAPLLGSGISAMASGMMPQKPGAPGGGTAGGHMPMGPPTAPAQPPPGPQPPQAMAGMSAPTGGMPPVARPQGLPAAPGKPPMDPALMRFVYGAV